MVVAQSSSRRAGGDEGRRRIEIPVPLPSGSSHKGAGGARRPSVSQARGPTFLGAGQGASDHPQGEKHGSRTRERSLRAEEVIPPPQRRRIETKEEAAQGEPTVAEPVFVVLLLAAAEGGRHQRSQSRKQSRWGHQALVIRDARGMVKEMKL